MIGARLFPAVPIIGETWLIPSYSRYSSTVPYLWFNGGLARLGSLLVKRLNNQSPTTVPRVHPNMASTSVNPVASSTNLFRRLTWQSSIPLEIRLAEGQPGAGSSTDRYFVHLILALSSH